MINPGFRPLEREAFVLPSFFLSLCSGVQALHTAWRWQRRAHHFASFISGYALQNIVGPHLTIPPVFLSRAIICLEKKKELHNLCRRLNRLFYHSNFLTTPSKNSAFLQRGQEYFNTVKNKVQAFSKLFFQTLHSLFDLSMALADAIDTFYRPDEASVEVLMHCTLLMENVRKHKALLIHSITSQDHILNRIFSFFGLSLQDGETKRSLIQKINFCTEELPSNLKKVASEIAKSATHHFGLIPHLENIPILKDLFRPT